MINIGNHHADLLSSVRCKTSLPMTEKDGPSNTLSFLSLPAEIRVKIYHHAFSQSKAIIIADSREDISCILSCSSKLQHPPQRSSQLLQTCKAILFEARPILYASTVFHVIIAQAFAGRLPSTLTDGHIVAPYVQHLVWQVDCDMMKHYYAEDLRLDPTSFAELESLELRIGAETWRNSFLGEWCDREAFVRGREQAMEYAKVLKEMMVSGRNGEVSLVEDRSQLGRGRVILRLSRGVAEMRTQQQVLLS